MRTPDLADVYVGQATAEAVILMGSIEAKNWGVACMRLRVLVDPIVCNLAIAASFDPAQNPALKDGFHWKLERVAATTDAAAVTARMTWDSGRYGKIVFFLERTPAGWLIIALA